MTKLLDNFYFLLSNQQTFASCRSTGVSEVRKFRQYLRSAEQGIQKLMSELLKLLKLLKLLNYNEDWVNAKHELC